MKLHLYRPACAFASPQSGQALVGDENKPQEATLSRNKWLEALFLILCFAYIALCARLGVASVQREPADETNGIVTIPSNHSVGETVAKLQNLLQAKGVVLFAVIDHSGEAAKEGVKMPDTKVLIFGNPKKEAPLMPPAPSAAIDLPLRILVAEDSQGKVWISYNSPTYLKHRHGLRQDLVADISIIETLAAEAAE
jgi:uncharacterized protein (DUF302 family)